MCEDYPCCGHEQGDCEGQKYGSDESIMRNHRALINSGMDDYEIDMYYESQNSDGYGTWY